MPTIDNLIRPKEIFGVSADEILDVAAAAFDLYNLVVLRGNEESRNAQCKLDSSQGTTDDAFREVSANFDGRMRASTPTDFRIAVGLCESNPVRAIRESPLRVVLCVP